MRISELLLICVGCPLVAGWTAAWLGWFFQGDVRNWIVAHWPVGWRAGRTRNDLLTVDQEDMDTFLSSESEAPALLCGILSCPRCMSAHLAGIGSIPIACFLGEGLALVPLMWATGAWLGFKLHTLKR